MVKQRSRVRYMKKMTNLSEYAYCSYIFEIDLSSIDFKKQF